MMSPRLLPCVLLCGALQAGPAFGQTLVTTDGRNQVLLPNPVLFQQSGIVNQAGLTQADRLNIATIRQFGFSNKLALVQSGDANRADILQQGAFNRVRVIQVGPDNDVVVNQDGDTTQSRINQQLTNRLRTLGLPALALYADNFLAAPDLIGGSIELGRQSVDVLHGTLFSRLDAARLDPCHAWPPQRTQGKPPDAILACDRPRYFIDGTFAGGERASQPGRAGFNSRGLLTTVGVEYGVSNQLRLGAAVGFNQSSADQKALRGTVDGRFLSFSFFGTYMQERWFADGIASFGIDRYETSRRGFDVATKGNANGSHVSAAGRLGYLFDVGPLRIGPVAGLSYLRNWLDAYRESGDPLLTQTVGQQRLETLTGSAGLQLYGTWPGGASSVRGVVTLTAEQEFLSPRRTIRSSFVDFPGVAVVTPIQASKVGTYGKVVGSAEMAFSSTFSGSIHLGTTFARRGGDDRSIGVSVKGAF